VLLLLIHFHSQEQRRENGCNVHCPHCARPSLPTQTPFLNVATVFFLLLLLLFGSAVPAATSDNGSHCAATEQPERDLFEWTGNRRSYPSRAHTQLARQQTKNTERETLANRKEN